MGYNFDYNTPTIISEFKNMDPPHFDPNWKPDKKYKNYGDIAIIKLRNSESDFLHIKRANASFTLRRKF